MIYTLTLNPAVDVGLFVSDFHFDKVNRVCSETKVAGGKGINSARVLSSLGLSCTNFVLLGENNGFEYSRLLGDSAGECVFHFVGGEIRENITLKTENENIKINRSGFECNEVEITPFIESIPDKTEADSFIIIAGSLPKGISIDYFIEICKLLKFSGLKIILDVDFLNEEQAIDISPFLLRNNIDEFGRMCGCEFSSDRDATKKILQFYEAGINSIITFGKDGFIGCEDENLIKIIPPDIQEACTVGAGDSLTAGYLYALINGLDFEKRLTYAAGAAAVVVSRRQGEPFLVDKINEFLPLFKIERSII